jgi:hypothetical protein
VKASRRGIADRESFGVGSKLRDVVISPRLSDVIDSCSEVVRTLLARVESNPGVADLRD